MTTAPHLLFPMITYAALEMAYDNGGINRQRSEADLMNDLDSYLRYKSEWKYVMINIWLMLLTHEELLIVSCGGLDEMQRLMRCAPFGADELLNQLFEEVI